ncbi:DUF1758 domain-containing protein [Trichonephila clavipes]|nr:DUF1758 domain-containing protein [Trichonephila clavipes]
MAHENIKWTETLPAVLLGLRVAVKPDINASSAELVYGVSLRLPAEICTDTSSMPLDYGFVQQLKNHMNHLKPLSTSTHGFSKIFVHPKLDDCSHVFLRVDKVSPSLSQPYTGPHEVLSRNDKHITININGKKSCVSLDRVKPAFVFRDLPDTIPDPIISAESSHRHPVTTNMQTTKSGRRDELRNIADELKLVVPDNAKVLDLRELIQESEIYKNDKETYQAIVDCVLEEINDRRNENENRLEIEKLNCHISGSVGDEVRDNNIHCGLIRDSDLNTTLRSFWELESIGVKNENCSSEEDVSFEMFKQRVHFKNGRYEVELPWKRDSNELSDNFSLAKRRLGSLMRKMQRDKVLYSEYCKVLKNYLDVGIIEKVTNPFIPTNNPVFYLPHQVIIKNESLTTKLRLVFDASAHEEKQLSLNDCLFHGVNLNPNILDLLISFRSNKIAVLADVEKAFLQISLAPKDRDVVRFLIDDGENGVQVYRFNRVLFWRERVSVSFGCND